jgi:hypothetical protein
MPYRSERADPVAEAVALAQDIGGDIATILFTHYPDADTLDTLRPGGPSLATATAINRAAAAKLAAQGVEIFAQKADRAAFRRWMQGRDDTPAIRRAWIDRDRLLRGAEAHHLLGIAPRPPAPPKRFAAAPGPIADRLLAAWLADDDEFPDLAEALLAAGRADVLELAVRKAAATEDDETADALELDLLAAAEAGRFGPSGWAGLVALPAALPPGPLPDAEALGAAFAAAGIARDTVTLRFLPGWRSPEALSSLAPAALRRVLLALLAGAEPADLPPADADELAARGFGVLLGLEIDWDIPVWEEIAATGLPDEDEDREETPAEARRARLFDTWRAAVFEAHDGCVPLALVPPSEADAEIAAFLEEAGEHTDSIDEIRECIAMARQEAGGEEVVCRAEIAGEGLELALYTAGGRFLDSLSLPAERMPASTADMLRMVAGLVRVVPETPG